LRINLVSQLRVLRAAEEVDGNAPRVSLDGNTLMVVVVLNRYTMQHAEVVPVPGRIVSYDVRIGPYV
jgi:hypothetical protein